MMECDRDAVYINILVFLFLTYAGNKKTRKTASSTTHKAMGTGARGKWLWPTALMNGAWPISRSTETEHVGDSVDNSGP